MSKTCSAIPTSHFFQMKKKLTQSIVDRQQSYLVIVVYFLENDGKLKSESGNMHLRKVYISYFDSLVIMPSWPIEKGSVLWNIMHKNCWAYILSSLRTFLHWDASVSSVPSIPIYFYTLCINFSTRFHLPLVATYWDWVKIIP